MRNAFTLLGVTTLIVSIGAFIAFSNKVEAPIEIIQDNREIMSLTLSSPVFKEGERIPSKYTCDAENINPELHINNIPEGTQSLVLVMDDPDIPESVKLERGVDVIDHWALYNISPETTVIPEGSAPGTQGLNTRGEAQYRGPCPPDREHRYFFRLYALSGTLNFIKTPTLREIEEAAKSMMIEQTTFMGRYERIETPQP
jgi:Raf kinase inhibitor-like YbhB/YbcL family protein